MVANILIDGLKHPTPEGRIEMLQVLAMLEETQALPALRSMMSTEKNPEVIDAIKWAGSMIWEAQQRGHSTEEAIRREFRLHLEKTEDEHTEAKKLAEIQSQLDLQLIKDKKESLARTTKSTLAWGAMGAVLGGPMMGANMIMAGAMNMATSGPESGLGPRPQIGTQAIAPQRPSDHDISIWIKRLKETDPKKRRAALIELKSLNNPAALPHLATYFISDPDEEFRQEAQRTAKSIYYNWYYWEQTRANAATPPARATGTTQAVPAATVQPSQSLPPLQQPKSSLGEPDQQNIDEILKKAQAAKRAREAKKLK